MTNSPNDDLTQQKFKIGKWEARPFTLLTAILLEKIDSPFMKTVTDPTTGAAVPQIPTISEVAAALYIILNWDKPFINDMVGDPVKFANEVGQLAAQLTMRDFAAITVQLNDMMSQLNNAVTESGLPKGGEKKDGTGPSA